MSRVIAAFAQFFDGAGDPLENGWLKFLVSGTTSTEKATFSDQNQSIPNANPVQLDAEGRCPNVFGYGKYKVQLYTNNPVTKAPGSLIASFDPVYADISPYGAGDNFAEWSVDQDYNKGSIVIYQGNYFFSIQNANLGNTPAKDSAYWEQFAFLRYWNTNQTYAEDDVVVHNAALYFSIQDNNQGNDPEVSPLYWDSVGSGTILINWEEVGTIFRPGSSGYMLGDSTHLIGNAFFQDSANIYLGDSQDLAITFDGTEGNINCDANLTLATNNANSIYFKTTNVNRWLISSGGILLPTSDNVYNLGDVTARIKNFYAVDIFGGDVHIDASSYALFGSAGNLAISHDDNDSLIRCITGKIQFDITANNLEVLVNGTAKWQFDYVTGGHLLPVTANTMNIGSVDNEISYLYVGSSGGIYVGASQELYIKADGAVVELFSNGFDLNIGTVGANSIVFYTTNVSRWAISGGGTLSPLANNTYNIGSTGATVDSIYLGTYLILGTGQTSDIYDTGTNLYVRSDNNIFIQSTNANPIYFRTNAINRWNVSADGHFLAHNNYDIGSSSQGTGDIFIGSGYFLKLGSSQTGELGWDSDVILRASDAMYFIITDSHDMLFYTNNTERMRIDDSTPRLLVDSTVRIVTPHTYSNAESGRAIIVDSAGNNGTAEASVADKKANITVLTDKDTKWIYDVDAVSYTLKTDYNEGLEFGLVAEQVQDKYADMCCYDYEWEDALGKFDRDGKQLKKKIEHKKTLYGVKYRSVYIAMLREIQELNKRVIELERAN